MKRAGNKKAATRKLKKKKKRTTEPKGPRRYEYVKGTAAEFWQIELVGSSYRTRWGRIGAFGTHEVKTFASSGAARREYERQIRAKLGEGYAEAKGDTKPRKKAGSAVRVPLTKAGSPKKLPLTVAEALELPRIFGLEGNPLELGEPWSGKMPKHALPELKEFWSRHGYMNECEIADPTEGYPEPCDDWEQLDEPGDPSDCTIEEGWGSSFAVELRRGAKIDARAVAPIGHGTNGDLIGVALDVVTKKGTSPVVKVPHSEPFVVRIVARSLGELIARRAFAAAIHAGWDRDALDPLLSKKITLRRRPS